MGEYKNYCCMPPQNALQIISTMLPIAYLGVAILDVAFIIVGDKIIDIIFSVIAIVLYIMAAFTNCYLQCTSNEEFIKRYKIVSITSIIYIFIDGFYRIFLPYGTAFFHFLTAFFAIISLYAVHLIQEKLKDEQQGVINACEVGGTQTIVTIGESEYPKFAMAVQVMKVEYTDRPEVEGLNKN